MYPEAAEGVVFSGTPGAAADRRKVLMAVIQKTYFQGISTRSVDDLVKAMA